MILRANHVIFISLAVMLLTIGASCDSPDENGLKKSEVHEIIHNPASANSINSTALARIDGGPFIFDAGDVQEGAVIRHRFHFINSSKNSLEKINVSSTCGCTVAKFDETKIAPGAKDSIDVIFDTKGFSGRLEKTITLICNTNPKENHFTIIANVNSP